MMSEILDKVAIALRDSFDVVYTYDKHEVHMQLSDPVEMARAAIYVIRQDYKLVPKDSVVVLPHDAVPEVGDVVTDSNKKVCGIYVGRNTIEGMESHNGKRFYALNGDIIIVIRNGKPVLQEKKND